MNAKFGKLSIWSFVALWAAFFLLYIQGGPGCGFSQPIMLMIFIGPVCLFLGILFGIIGVKKDSSKTYSLIGLLLNLGLVFLYLLKAIL